MDNSIKSKSIINNREVFYTDKGKGTSIVLLHGYLESLEIWGRFSNELSKKHRVISIDIPGHGDSETIPEPCNMQHLAQTIVQLLNHLNIDKSFIIGHSMGGYITLMIHKLFPEMLSGFCLFHSHPFPDTDEIRKKRLREIDFVKDGKKDLIAKFNIPNAFATDNLHKFKDEINDAIQIALKTKTDGIIANLLAMMNRPDMSEDLMKSEIPFLYIIGKKDNYIDYQNIVNQVLLPEVSELHLLENSGHMGFIEEYELSLEIISNFIKSKIHE